jgi:S1-C subfamily serine protease
MTIGRESEQPVQPAEKGSWRARGLRLRQRALKVAPFVSGILAAFLGLLLYNALFPAPQPLSTKEMNEVVAQAMASATPAPAYSARVYEAIHPSLVLIQSHGKDSEGEDQDGLGSGVVINDQGDILTSLHVVAGASAIEVFFADGTESSAEVLAAQPEKDIAVLRATQPPPMLFPATLGNPNAMRIGDEAFAVGNPFGLYGSMSAGVISGFDRAFFPPDSDQKLEGLIQIDAAVNPGNSGGPLLNRYGQVVGIVVGIVNPTDQEVFIGIGFAVPIDVAAGAAGYPPY